MNSLWALIPAAIGWSVFCVCAAWGAIAALTWAGRWIDTWRKPKPAIIESHAQVVELAPGTILRDSKGYAWLRGTGSWVGTGEGPAYAPEAGWNDGLELPATILWDGARQ
ncbi:hypothetical protein SEA_ODAY_109 [Gordonia phage ODay]|nr:hypothetical protein SEA_ODAY_109 [Gordonia phage ODay]